MKNRIIKILSVVLSVLIPAGSLLLSGSAAQPDTVEQMLSSMTTEEKITQMFMIAPRYYDGVGVTELNEKLADLFGRYAFGGAILFAQNAVGAEQTLRLTDSLQKANAADGRPQLFISIDQEGGAVSRLATGTLLTGNMALGATGSEEAAHKSGEIIGEELSALGINVDFAPVLDVNSDPSNPVIGTRSFSDDPGLVSEMGRSFIRGLHSKNIITALKHFPGHGDTGTDSHTGLPVIEKTYSELKKNELRPFAAGISAGAEMIMTAHIQYPNIETGTYRSALTGEDIFLPATLSETIITDILRGDMGYNGVVVTDAMNMDAIAGHFKKLDAIELAINAGIDMLLMPGAPYSASGIKELENTISRTVGRVESGKISMERVDAAVRRILTLKEKRGLLDAYRQGDIDARIEAAKATVGSKEHHEAEFEIAKDSFTLIKNDGDMLPLREKDQNVLILTAYENELLSVEYGKGLAAENGLIPEGVNVTVGCYGDASDETLDLQIEKADVVIGISELTSAAGLDPEKPAGAGGRQLDKLIKTAHEKGARFMILSAHLPYDCVRFPDADAVVLCWSDKGMSEDPREIKNDIPQYGPCIPAAIYMMFAKFETVEGRLPVDIPAITEDYVFSDDIALERGYGLSYKEFCRYCGESHDKDTADKLKGLLHKLLYWLREFFDRLKEKVIALFERLRTFIKNKF